MATYEFADDATIGEIYRHIEHINTPEEAKEYFDALVERNMRVWHQTREESEQVIRSNLGYYSGYYSHEMMVKVAQLFDATHPVFGNMAKREPVTAGEALEAGLNMGRATRKGIE